MASSIVPSSGIRWITSTIFCFVISSREVVMSTSPDSVILERELVILAERVPFPIVGKQDARQVRVAGEPDAGEIVNLALVPLGAAPDRRDRRHLGQRAGC